MGNIVQYGTYSAEDAAADGEELKKGSDSVMRKFEQGETVIRILPPLPGKKVFMQVWTHFVHDVNGDLVAVFACPKGQEKKPCPVCAQAEKLRGTGSPADEVRAKKLWPERKIYVNVIFRDAEKDGPLVATMGKMIHEKLVYLRQKRGIDFVHPESGVDLIIDKTGGGKNDIKYEVFPGDKRPLGNMEWIGQQHDLDKFAKVPTLEEINAKLRGEGGGGKRAGGGNGRDLPARREPQRTVGNDVVDAEFEPAGAAAGGDDEFPY